jgi:hypothetical protein
VTRTHRESFAWRAGGEGGAGGYSVKTGCLDHPFPCVSVVVSAVNRQLSNLPVDERVGRGGVAWLRDDDSPIQPAGPGHLEKSRGEWQSFGLTIAPMAQTSVGQGP